jgi:hypothetical protein
VLRYCRSSHALNPPQMKMMSTLWIAIAALAFSCKKHKNTDPADRGTLSAVLSAGALFGSSFQSSVPVSQYAVRANQQFEILGYAISGKDSIQLDMTFPDTLTVGRPFSDASGTQFMLQLVRLDSSENYTSYYCKEPSTTITITSWDKTAGKIAGSFSGKIAPVPPNDSITVTNGVFDTKYKTYP